MLVITGVSDRVGEMKNYPFALRELIPVRPKEGDMFVLFPIHHKERDYGYMVFLNEYLPIEVYNYRICHESLGISIENLHKQMILKRSIEELDRLHMVDQMTGLYNRFAISRFKKEYIQRGRYAVVMIDMDGLKVINDSYGHLAGNNAICTTANAIRKSLNEDDLIIRYGGDEFVVLSRNTDMQFWTKMREDLNLRIKKSVDHQKLPYKVGASLGFAIVDRNVEKLDFEKALEAADRGMYEDKKRRKAGRKPE